MREISGNRWRGSLPRSSTIEAGLHARGERLFCAIMINALLAARSSCRLFFIFAAGTILFAAGGCSKNGGGQTPGNTGDYVNGTPLPERREGTSFFGSNVERNRFRPIYFDFDSQSVRASETGKVQEIASFMQSNSSDIIIAGFTDERGTAEYNRGLGDRRAGAVREGLIAAGADANRIQTVSFGAEMPADNGSGESAWAKNRRAEIGVITR